MAPPPFFGANETKRPEKIFLSLRVFWARQHRRRLAARTVPSGCGKISVRLLGRVALPFASLLWSLCFAVLCCCCFWFRFGFAVRLLRAWLAAWRVFVGLAYFIACWTWWTNLFSSPSLIIVSIVSFARPSIIWGTDKVWTASSGPRPEPVL